MVGICSPVSPYSSIQHRLQRVNGFRCCSSARAYMKKKAQPSPTPQLLKIAVSGVTELLRFFSSGKDRLDTENYDQRNKVSLLSIEDVLRIIKSDYESAYFVTGIFSSAIYSEDCLFEDPTIKFRVVAICSVQMLHSILVPMPPHGGIPKGQQGTELYARNLKLLVPFFDHPSIALKKIEKGVDAETNFVLATWKLRTYLRLPWRPLISINGSTVYDLDDKFKIISHAEGWDVSALEAIGQIFTPSFERSNG